ncbi:hypothetical protein GCM10027052_28260 [Parafrigoribacterium mesophilum]|uniref:protein kinase domain-containing protein n=1 Tax=Parafrigoribacterium mesophilum TaxID=433646 RepID=UPI0031FC5C3B
MDTIGGYRLVRLLGFGARAEVYLGHAGAGAEGAPRAAALKRYRPGVDRHSIDTELEALSRADSPHLLRLRDVATDSSGMPCAILQRLGADNLAHILIARNLLAAGEAVTILAPLVRAVAELHRAGVAHGAVRLSTVLFDEVGAPVLIGFGAATLIGAQPAGAEHSLTAAQLSAHPAVLRDLTDVAALCSRVLDRTQHTGSGSDRLSQFLDATRAVDLDARSFPEELAERIFELAEPLPVMPAPPFDSVASDSVASDSVASDSVASDRGGLDLAAPGYNTTRRYNTMRSAPGIVALEPSAVGRPTGRRRALHRRAPDDASSAGVTARWRPGPVSWTQRLHPAWWNGLRRRGVRKPFWLAGAVGVAVCVGALAMIPSQGPSRAVVPPSPSTSPRAASPSLPAPSSAPESTGAEVGDDPAEATRQLLRVRAGCLAGRSADCLRRVDQEDSAALDHDTQLIASGATSAQDELFPIDAATLTERLGDGALVSVNLPGSGAAPVSVLVIRTASGWRIRDVLVG